MPEQRALQRQGPMTARLARWRVPLGFVFGVVVFWRAAPTRASLAVGAVVAAAGELMRVWAAGHLNKAREVTASGPYRWVAHPLYVGSTVMGVGLAVAANSVLVAGLVAVYLSATLTAAVRSEEAFLRERFGDAYDRYRRADGSARVQSRPHSDGVDPSVTRRFSVRRAIANREHRAVAGVVVALLLLALKATYNGSFWRAAR